MLFRSGRLRKVETQLAAAQTAAPAPAAYVPPQAAPAPAAEAAPVHAQPAAAPAAQAPKKGGSGVKLALGAVVLVGLAGACATGLWLYMPRGLGEMAGGPPTPTPGTMGSMGAAGVDMATIRRMAAEELPVPVRLTKGQAERSFEQQRFERETAKDPARGLPLRERFADQNEAILKNFDVWADETGAQLIWGARSLGLGIEPPAVALPRRAELRMAVASARRCRLQELWRAAAAARAAERRGTADDLTANLR